MFEVLEFIFQSFWHWLGALVLLSAVASCFGGTLVSMNVHVSGSEQKKEKSDDHQSKNDTRSQ